MIGLYQKALRMALLEAMADQHDHEARLAYLRSFGSAPACTCTAAVDAALERAAQRCDRQAVALRDFSATAGTPMAREKAFTATFLAQTIRGMKSRMSNLYGNPKCPPPEVSTITPPGVPVVPTDYGIFLTGAVIYRGKVDLARDAQSWIIDPDFGPHALVSMGNNADNVMRRLKTWKTLDEAFAFAKKYKLVDAEGRFFIDIVPLHRVQTADGGFTFQMVTWEDGRTTGATMTREGCMRCGVMLTDGRTGPGWTCGLCMQQLARESCL